MNKTVCDKVKKYIPELFVIFYVVSFIIALCAKLDPTVTILFLTGLIVLWYTIETYRTRKLEERIETPAIGTILRLNTQYPADVQFKIWNQSDFPVSALVKMTFSVKNNTLKTPWDDYNGDKFWNLQYHESLCGHFNWVTPFVDLLGINSNDCSSFSKLSGGDLYNALKNKVASSETLDDNSKLMVSIEIFSKNQKGRHDLYPKRNYEFDYKRNELVAEITSTRPIWDLIEIPTWVENKF